MLLLWKKEKTRAMDNTIPSQEVKKVESWTRGYGLRGGSCRSLNSRENNDGEVGVVVRDGRE